MTTPHHHADASHSAPAALDTVSAPPVPRAAPAWPWWLLRLGVTIQVLLAFAQPIIAGRFLAGDFSMLALHRTNGSIVGSVTMAQIVTSLLVWRPGRGPLGPFWASLVLGAATALQLYAGFNHLLGLHIPLGVAIVGLNGWLASWAWRHGPSAPAPLRSGSPT